MPNQRPVPVRGATYRSSAYAGLLPWQVRGRRFRRARLGRRGLAPDEVYAFLDRVAGDLAAVQHALAESRRETARVKGALRDWQSAQARARGYDR
ncbi:cell division protein DivIVA [Micromonospora craterilacus]|uniref:Cell division protein DivIVA n=1 Tax=Micromonospora craterilacus TaxID=1655439 RepID=A0A2W2EBY0_9ACTN|nr:DivIVA domain-containing protein [Micromonospora craterilacus]PZG14379.1 cell division protein DivIVA [Micromonospora craterilacus]